MKVVFGDLWDELGKADLLLVTANASVRKDGRLVMGRGAAKEARDRFPDLDLDLGRAVHQESDFLYGGRRRYGVVLASDAYDRAPRLGVFQVKYGWSERADLDLIAYGRAQLLLLAPDYPRIVMNYPGIGNGGLCIEDVEPIMSGLPDNVFLYRK